MRDVQAQPVQRGRSAGRLRPALCKRLLHVPAVEAEPAQPPREALNGGEILSIIWLGVCPCSGACRAGLLGRSCGAVAAESRQGTFDGRPLLVRHDQAHRLPTRLSHAHRTTSPTRNPGMRKQRLMSAALPCVSRMTCQCSGFCVVGHHVPAPNGVRHNRQAQWGLASAARRALSLFRRASSAATRAASRCFFLSACARRTRVEALAGRSTPLACIHQLQHGLREAATLASGRSRVYRHELKLAAPLRPARPTAA